MKSSISIHSKSPALFCHSVVSNSLQPHGLQHARLPCPSPILGVYSKACPWEKKSCPWSRWWHSTISFPVILFSYCLNLSQHQGLSNESVLCIRWPKYWSFSFNISPSNEYSGLISFRMDCLSKGWIVLAVQGTLKSLLQHHSSKASILRYSAF